MRCREYGAVQKIRIGLHEVGIVGLWEAFGAADESELAAEDDLVDLLLAQLAQRNDLPEERHKSYRRALWREYQRYRGEASRGYYSEYYSEVDVVVSGAAGAERDAFVEMLRAVFARFELEPRIVYEATIEGERNPQLSIDDQVIVRGPQPPRAFKQAPQRSFSDR